MTLDRDSARALFDNAPAPAAGVGVGATPLAAGSPFGPADATPRKPARKGPDWRLIAPVGVAAVLGGVAFLVTQSSDKAEPGRTVARSAIAQPAPAPLPPAPTPVQVAEAGPATVDAPAAPVARSPTRAAPARRARPPAVVATAPSATESSADASANEYQRYVPPTEAAAPVPPPPVIAPQPAPDPAPPTPIPPG